MLGVGATAGGVIFVVSLLLLIFTKMDRTKLIQALLVGVVLIIISVVFEKYLIPILITGIILGGVVAAYYIWQNWEKLKAMVQMTDEVIKENDIPKSSVHIAADKTIGPEGSGLREKIKATVASVRNNVQA